MQNYTINREDGTINFFEQTFTIEDFKNRCAKYHENRDLSIYEPITLGEAETLIRLGYITVLFYDKTNRHPAFDHIKCDDYTVVVYCEPQSDGSLSNIQPIDAICDGHYPVTSHEVIETIWYAGNHSPQGVLTTLDAIGDALAELDK